MRRRDLADVARMEAESFPDPWPADAFAALLGSRRHVARVLERDGRVLGFFVLEIEGRRCHLTNLVIDTPSRRQGLARRALATIERSARRRRCREVYLEVRASNDAARQTYADSGFVEKGELRGYYGRAHGILMIKALPRPK